MERRSDKHPLYEDTDPDTNQVQHQLMQSSNTLYAAVMNEKNGGRKKTEVAGIDEETGQIIGLEKVN